MYAPHITSIRKEIPFLNQWNLDESRFSGSINPDSSISFRLRYVIRLFSSEKLKTKKISDFFHSRMLE